MDLVQPFIYCGVCHKDGTYNDGDGKADPFWLTSCAHILCREHVGGKMLRPADLERLRIRCPVCQTQEVSVVRLSNNLPGDLKPYFKPFPSQIEALFAAAQFQYCGMAELISHQKKFIDKLFNKIDKQKQLLYAAKAEVSQVEDLKIKMTNLEKANLMLNKELQNIKLGYQNERQGGNSQFSSSIASITNRKITPSRPETVDLTHFDDENEQDNSDNNNPKNHETFIRKIQQSSTLKKIPTSSQQQQRLQLHQPSFLTLSSTAHSQDKNLHISTGTGTGTGRLGNIRAATDQQRYYNSDESGLDNEFNNSGLNNTLKPIMAESTNLFHSPFMNNQNKISNNGSGNTSSTTTNSSLSGRQTNNNLIVNRSASMSPLTSHGKTSLEGNLALNNNKLSTIPRNNNINPKKPGNNSIRNRSATTQNIVQRLTSHMKVGGGNKNQVTLNTTNGRLGTTNNSNNRSPLPKRN
ncbi:hypothetical protein PACTADRAFT_2251 [Pachysolen tannophilus NRRL Y-2460]|uniref:RING-type domain-containing protein n=1 Tax=Pachysolen tannophilus NRRL Y-2460 TaxID=669874 RepID=A0A1E4TWB2_PACTA|nr:hypothetical protein PACTADRAFT_2251 [Pachysolen tannophilus NRRL Y-2460]